MPATTNEAAEAPRLYVYKLTTDNNGAPCVYRGLLSLAICKPFIRTTASRGDLIFGFAGNSLHPDNRLIYVARVSSVVAHGDYYRGRRYRHRPDCIYEEEGERFLVRQPPPRYHGTDEDLRHDLGSEPRYERASVLLSDDFRYFGSSGLADLSIYVEIEEAVATLRRGYLVNHTRELRDQLLQLADMLWRQHDQRIIGQPSQTPPSTRSAEC